MVELGEAHSLQGQHGQGMSMLKTCRGQSMKEETDPMGRNLDLPIVSLLAILEDSLGVERRMMDLIGTRLIQGLVWAH